MNELTKAQIVDLVTRLYNGEGSEEEVGEWIELLQRNVPHPDISNLIFWPAKDLTPEEIVEEAFHYKPIYINTYRGDCE
ncbi:bacteriocin immunity protein [Paenibacillus sp. EZ-K15]|uniref:bacteriocin immunity protein n=1 Tax=Paenibacillus sp. EZ-K15 TaxID=2044275 RepID=UPI000BF65FA6|nr:bacteriocin immunity protein [Paenibacillus sp. EZ-K15]